MLRVTKVKNIWVLKNCEWDSRSIPRRAGWWRHYGNCKEDCEACEAEVPRQTWWTPYRDVACNLAAYADQTCLDLKESDQPGPITYLEAEAIKKGLKLLTKERAWKMRDQRFGSQLAYEVDNHLSERQLNTARRMMQIYEEQLGPELLERMGLQGQ